MVPTVNNCVLLFPSQTYDAQNFDKVVKITEPLSVGFR